MLLFSIQCVAQPYIVGTDTLSPGAYAIGPNNPPNQNKTTNPFPITVQSGSFFVCSRSSTIYRTGTCPVGTALPQRVINMPGAFTQGGGPVTITCIGWQAASTCTFTGRLRIYMKHTILSSGLPNWTTQIINGATLVYDGIVTFNNVAGSYSNISLQTPFIFNNVDNLQVSVEFDRTGYAYNGCGPSWYRTNDGCPIGGFGQNITIGNNIGNSCAADLNNLASTYFPNTIFNGCCLPPVLAITNVCAQGTTADLTNPSVTSGSQLNGATLLEYFSDEAGTIPVPNPASVLSGTTYYIKTTNTCGSDKKPVIVTPKPTLTPIYHN